MPATPPVRTSLRQYWWLAAASVLLLVLVLWRVFGASMAELQPEPAVARRSDATNGFDLSGLSVAPALVVKGADSRQAIAPLIDPPLWEGQAVADINDRWRRERHQKALVPNDAVIGVAYNGEARAFPLCILNWHEVADCTLGSQRIAVTYCPLTASAAVYRLEGNSRPGQLAASGLLYNSNTLLYDPTATAGEESLYCQLTGVPVSGPAAQVQPPLARIPAELTLWGDWLARYPESTVVSLETGFSREYEADTYGNYYDRGKLRFPAAAVPEDELGLMARCIALPQAEGWIVYPHVLVLSRCGTGNEWRNGGLVFTVLRPTAPALAPEIRVAYEDSAPADAVPGLWFALKGLLPDVVLAQ